MWAPSQAAASDYAVPATILPGHGAVAQTGEHRTQPYDLAALLDLAMRDNPDTRAAWESARMAAAAFGSARAPYYPTVSAIAQNGYNRALIELPVEPAIFKQWESQPLIQLTYTLIDFGRRSSSAEAARQQLAAANFRFDRRIQDIVFGVQRAYYALNAANAAVLASRQDLELAESDFDAVQQRLNLGLATQPELLLASERVAQSRYDVTNAELMVHDAQAALAVAVGVPANTVIEVASFEGRAVPKALDRQVDELIADTIRQRPDLSASVADLRASQAHVALAKAAWYPTVGLTAFYGQQIWNYTFQGPPTISANQPQYSALVTLQWDVFTGLKRLNDVRQAEAEDAATRAGLRSTEVSVIADVWRAYYEFQSAQKKYAYAQALLAATQEAYDANIETYRQGLSTIVELLTAQRDLANARYTLISSRAELLTSYAAVAYAAGAVKAP
jgi:outer membrane protein